MYFAAVLAEYALLSASGVTRDASTLLLQLSLAGDFFQVPYALGEVEWTLRVEIVFYLLMAAFRSLGLMKDEMRRLPFGLLAAAVACIVVAPFPTIPGWSFGYLTIYGPYLLLGAAIQRFEHKSISWRILVGFVALIFTTNYSLLLSYNQNALEMHYGPLALVVFLGAWTTRRMLPSGRLLIVTSELTYSVYLFHNWLFDYFRSPLIDLGAPHKYADLMSIILLLLFCALANRVIERPGIRLGHHVLRRFRAGRPSPAF